MKINMANWENYESGILGTHTMYPRGMAVSYEGNNVSSNIHKYNSIGVIVDKTLSELTLKPIKYTDLR